MDFTDPPAITAFRTALRAWLAAELPGHPGPFGTHDDEALANTQRWHRALAAAGYVGVSLPAAFGGRSLPDTYEVVINEELATAQAPPAPPVGHIAHAIADFADDQLRQRTLPGLLDCTVPWCQGFSEPGAGSDLASLTTTATRDGDTWVINGQKIWTSSAPWAKQCLLLARTEPAPRHKGLSMLVVDMATPGIDVRPITLANGSREFAEVFFDAAAVPAANLVGQRGQGWQIAMHMLGYERGPGDMGWVGRLGSVLATAVAEVRDGTRPADDPLRRRLASSMVDLTVLQWHVARSLSSRETTAPGAAGSIDKLLVTRIEQRLHHALADLAGPSFVLDDHHFNDYIWSRAQSVYGGTQQIQRRIVAQRVLNLPRST
jgi:alkylation response protein AidB-like acyl-CoA dehydrogenase